MTKTAAALLLLLISSCCVQAASSSVVLHSSDIRFHAGDDPRFAEPGFDDSSWQRVQVPFTWDTRAERTGWFRMKLTVKEPQRVYAEALNLGQISGTAEVFINGIPVPPVMEEKQISGTERLYKIPRAAASKGDSIAAVRITSAPGLRAGFSSSKLRAGSYTVLLRSYYAKEITQLALVALYFFTGIFFILFLRFTSREMPFHLFGFYCLACALFFAGQSDMLLRSCWSPFLFARCAKAAACASFPLLLIFITSIYRIRPHIIQTASIAMAAVSALIFLTAPDASSAVLERIIVYPSWAVPSIAILVIFARRSRQSKGDLMLFVLTLFSFLCLVGKILTKEQLLPHALYPAAEITGAYGFALFFFGISFVIFNMIFRMSAELQIKSYSLQLAVKEREAAFRSIDFAYTEALSLLAVIAEMRDQETGSHIRRVSHFTKLLAEKRGLPKEEIDMIFLAAPMHDVGKVGIPDRILLKKGALSEDEFSLMKRHTVTGGRIFAGAKSPVLMKAAEIAMTHHEKYCGGGYPGNLQGEEIPLSGRIMALADIYDALRSRRPYKEELPHEKVVEIILQGDGRTAPRDFDPELLRIFSLCHSQFNEIYLVNRD